MSSGMAIEPPSPGRSPWQRLYGFAHRLRRSWYRARASRLPRTVVSVGNLHWGGSGKTPLVAAVAAWLVHRGLHPVILSRGYRGKGKGIRVVSVGEGPLLGPMAAGDEPVLLAEQLPGVSVVVGADRYRAGQHALERLPRDPDIFLLEDGFSHLRLRRDLDILTFPSSDLFAGGRLWPSGRLREPLGSVRHADAVVVTGSEPPAGAELAAALEPFGFVGPGFSAAARVGLPLIERGERLRKGARILLVTGVARPQRVVESLEQLPYEVVDRIHFPDHHRYPDSSLERIAASFAAVGAEWIVTTGKDHVKLLGRLDLPLALLPLASEPEEAFWAWLERGLGDLRSKGRGEHTRGPEASRR